MRGTHLQDAAFNRPKIHHDLAWLLKISSPSRRLHRKLDTNLTHHQLRPLHRGGAFFWYLLYHFDLFCERLYVVVVVLAPIRARSSALHWRVLTTLNLESYKHQLTCNRRMYAGRQNLYVFFFDLLNPQYQSPEFW